jgi:hypothetical protein
MSEILTPRAALARDLLQSLEDSETARVENRDLARKNLARRTGIPKGTFWSARYRITNGLGRYLERLLEARAAALEEEIRELEHIVAAARSADPLHMAAEIRSAEALIRDAKERLAGVTRAARN